MLFMKVKTELGYWNLELLCKSTISVSGNNQNGLQIAIWSPLIWTPHIYFYHFPNSVANNSSTMPEQSVFYVKGLFAVM